MKGIFKHTNQFGKGPRKSGKARTIQSLRWKLTLQNARKRPQLTGALKTLLTLLKPSWATKNYSSKVYRNLVKICKQGEHSPPGPTSENASKNLDWSRRAKRETLKRNQRFHRKKKKQLAIVKFIVKTIGPSSTYDLSRPILPNVACHLNEEPPHALTLKRTSRRTHKSSNIPSSYKGIPNFRREN